MNPDNIPPSFIQLEHTKHTPVDYSVLDIKYSHDFALHGKYKTGQQYKIFEDKPLAIVRLIIDSVIDEIKLNTTDPNKKIILENHRSLLYLLIKNIEDCEINIDYYKLISIIDGVIYANTRQLYKKEY